MVAGLVDVVPWSAWCHFCYDHVSALLLESYLTGGHCEADGQSVGADVETLSITLISLELASTQLFDNDLHILHAVDFCTSLLVSFCTDIIRNVFSLHTIAVRAPCLPSRQIWPSTHPY